MENNNLNNIENHKKNTTPKKKPNCTKKIIIVIVSIIIIGVVLGIVLNKDKLFNASENNENSETSVSDTLNEFEQYLGKTYYSTNTNEQFKITDIQNNTIKFDISFTLNEYHGILNGIATIRNNKIEFVLDDGITGFLTFNNDEIIMYITDSINQLFVPRETYIYTINKTNNESTLNNTVTETSKYIGQWYDEDRYNDLKINSIENNVINFDFCFFRIGEYQNLIATITPNSRIAEFNTNNTDMGDFWKGVYGYIELGDDEIILKITKSECEYIHTGTYEFNVKD